MPVNSSLLTLLMGRSVVDRVSERYGITSYDLRTLSAIHCLSAIGKKASVRMVAELQGVSTTVHPRNSFIALRRSGFVSAEHRPYQHHVYKLTAPGLRLVGLLEREERDARRRIQAVDTSRKKRVYVRSGKYIGKAAKQKAKGQQ